MNVLFVTSGNANMYKTTGHDLVNRVSQKYPILVCTEGYDVLPMMLSNVRTYDLQQDEWLRKWLDTYSHIIPTEFGGSCVEKLPYFNKHASKWMRKVASIRHARLYYEFDVLIWIDMDSKILNLDLDALIRNSIRGVSCFYIDGTVRRVVDMGIETGIIGFDNKDGLNILDDWFSLYETGEFQTLKRWDDGYVIRNVLQNRGYTTRDMVNERYWLLLAFVFFVSFKLFLLLCLLYAYYLYTAPLTFSKWNNHVIHLKGTQKNMR